MDIRIAGIVKESFVDGPGVRYVIFAQGCSHKCSKCHNPGTHDFNGGYLMDADEILSDIYNCKHINGVTFSGGDPFFQSEGFAYLAEKLKKKKYHIMAYTGFIFEDILNNEKMYKLLKNIDVLIDGPFIESSRTFKLPYRGSSNQRAINVQESLKGSTIKLMEFI